MNFPLSGLILALFDICNTARSSFLATILHLKQRCTFLKDLIKDTAICDGKQKRKDEEKDTSNQWDSNPWAFSFHDGNWHRALIDVQQQLPVRHGYLLYIYILYSMRDILKFSQHMVGYEPGLVEPKWSTLTTKPHELINLATQNWSFLSKS